MDFFILKKIIGSLLMPLPIVIILLALGIILFNRKPKLAKGFIVAGTLLLAIISFMPIADKLIVQYEQEFPVFHNQYGEVEYVVVLGCGHTSDARLNPSQELKNCALQRLTEGMRILREQPQAKLITTGFNPYDNVSNATKLKQAAVELGLTPDQIITVSKPRDTADEAMMVAPIVKDSKFVLVTNANHMPRAIQYFIAEGLDPIPAPTGFLVKDPEGTSVWFNFIPDAANISKTERAWHETLGRIWQWLRS
ncbi:envelope biogenesis factor ElyC [Thalassotalea sp. PS06]|uniref:envelope biogenesis factor ElyC n=1 Tax=Thalassotalea sp. PS06 TaxID=2594005 RepID=UPI001163D595|nr:envelope biogenesis factor ElyC [Thalassotalea sp. PS06]QDP01405.1 envelope biogenesis factor ElyC [Thalassotalea sp. PS06]